MQASSFPSLIWFSAHPLLLPCHPLRDVPPRYLSEQRRHYYVTPTSYLELLLSYKGLLAKRQNEVRPHTPGGRQ